MNAINVSLLVFACTFGGVLLGMLLRSRLPEHHVSSDSKDTVKIGMGLVATMTALLLSLLIATAKGSYDMRKGEITKMVAEVEFLDRLLANYGPETVTQRAMLRTSVQAAIDGFWPHERAASPKASTSASNGASISASTGASTGASNRPNAESLYHSIHQLTPQSELQKTLKDKALSMAEDVGFSRWLLFAQTGTSISAPFLGMTILWLSMLFVSFGLFAPRNATVLIAMFACAVSVSGALFLVLELDHPFAGLIQIPSEPMRIALAAMGQ